MRFLATISPQCLHESLITWQTFVKWWFNLPWSSNFRFDPHLSGHMGHACGPHYSLWWWCCLYLKIFEQMGHENFNSSRIFFSWRLSLLSIVFNIPPALQRLHSSRRFCLMQLLQKSASHASHAEGLLTMYRQIVHLNLSSFSLFTSISVPRSSKKVHFSFTSRRCFL